MIDLKNLVICALLFWGTVESARILAIVPTASFSHQVFFRPYWKALANRGHEVVLVTTDPINDPTIKNLKEIDLGVSYKSWNARIMDMVTKNDDKIGAIKVMMEIMYEITEVQMSHPEIQRLYNDKDEHFDLLIMEYLLPAMFVFKHRFDVPFIGVTSLDAPYTAHEIVGNPVHSVLYPNPMLPFAENMSFLERLMSLSFEHYMMIWSSISIIPKLDGMVQKYFGEGIPSLEELGTEVDMIFTNSNPLFNVIRPFAPATISIAGGLNDLESKPLPEDLKLFLDNAKEGVIYFSLGSNVKSKDISAKTRQIIMDTFAKLPYKVLWKFEAEELPGKPDNVKIMKWLPQLDVLRHANVKVFVTQAGLQSLEESLFARVPLVAMPFFADQEANAHHVSVKGLGIQIDHATLTVDGFKAALVEVITNDQYRNKIQELADIIQDQPMKPLEKAIWWTEYVLRHKGAKHLRGPTIPFYQMYYLDIIGFLGAILGVILGLSYFVCKKIVCFVCKCKKGTKQVQKKKNN